METTTQPPASLAGEKSEQRCRRCGEPFMASSMTVLGIRLQANTCAECGETMERERIEEEKELERKCRLAAWTATTPPLYQDTDCMRLPDRLQDLILTWIPEARRGCIITGKTGEGKTRTAYQLLKKAALAGMSVVSVTHASLVRAVADQFADDPDLSGTCKERLRKFRNCGCLLLDDIGKASSTERADAEVEDLIEHRMAQRKPTLITSNAGGQWFIERFGKDRGPALVRRIAESSEIVKL